MTLRDLEAMAQKLKRHEPLTMAEQRWLVFSVVPTLMKEPKMPTPDRRTE